jgi:hypothetical protein
VTGIGNHCRHGAAADRLLDGPEQIGGTFHPAEDDLLRGNAKIRKRHWIGHTQILGIACKLQDDHRRPFRPNK